MSGMSLIVKTVARIFWPVLVLLAFYISLFGHLTPGGGFPGGVIFAGACILSVLSYGLTKDGKIEYRFIKDFTSKTAIIIIIALFLKSWKVLFGIPLPKGVPGELFSALPIVLVNIAVGLMVGFGITIAFYALISAKEKPEGDIH